MDQSEVNRFDNNKTKTEPPLKLNYETKFKNKLPPTQENEKPQKKNLVLQDSDQVMYSKPKNPKHNIFSMKPEKIGVSKSKEQDDTINNKIHGKVLPYDSFIKNQKTPSNKVSSKFGFESKPIVCPYCQQSSSTLIEESFNCCTCFIYIFVILLIPILLILAAYSGCHNVHCDNGCDCDCGCTCCGQGCDCKCCFDTIHFCPMCGKQIGIRNSCFELCPCFEDCC